MLRERYQASIPQHSAVLIRPHRCRKGHGWEKHKLRGVFNSEIFLISMQTPAQTQPGRLCTASWARPDSFRFPRSSPSGDSAPRSPPPPGPHLATDPEGPPEGTASPGLAEAQSVLRSRPGPPGSGPAGTPFATSAPSGPPPVSPRPPPPRLRACPGRSRVPRSPPLSPGPSHVTPPSARALRGPVPSAAPHTSGSAPLRPSPAPPPHWTAAPPLSAMLTAPPPPIGCSARHSARKEAARQGRPPGFGTRPRTAALPPSAARGPARFIPTSLGAHGARQPPPTAAVRREAGAGLRRPHGERRPRVSNAGRGTQGAPHRARPRDWSAWSACRPGPPALIRCAANPARRRRWIGARGKAIGGWAQSPPPFTQLLATSHANNLGSSARPAACACAVWRRRGWRRSEGPAEVGGGWRGRRRSEGVGGAGGARLPPGRSESDPSSQGYWEPGGRGRVLRWGKWSIFSISPQ